MNAIAPPRAANDERPLQERQRLDAGERQAQKMESVGCMTVGLAHDLNNLLAGVHGNLELMALRSARGSVDDQRHELGVALAACRRAVFLTKRLLSFSRTHSPEPTSVDVDGVVTEIADLIRWTLGARVELEIVETHDLAPVTIDVNRLESALLNLCINARDAMPDGGRITIATANQRVDQRAAADLGLVAGPYVLVSVTDTGTGMARDVREHAFDPFFTTKPMGRGTGLGLPMVDLFARESGGSVEVASWPGCGTTISIRLPQVSAVAAVAPMHRDVSLAGSAA